MYIHINNWLIICNLNVDIRQRACHIHPWPSGEKRVMPFAQRQSRQPLRYIRIHDLINIDVVLILQSIECRCELFVNELCALVSHRGSCDSCLCVHPKIPTGAWPGHYSAISRNDTYLCPMRTDMVSSHSFWPSTWNGTVFLKLNICFNLNLFFLKYLRKAVFWSARRSCSADSYSLSVGPHARCSSIPRWPNLYICSRR